ncbi:enoyl-CoA hydratase-related protein [Aeromicrobium sp. CF4.19]|uniref:enoyl-CoA hydratase-related protein n=1 Tax=Aeromicrobium sp. CF4.19 TaxID=3373082 RepID=UPI003EE5B502
MTVTREGSVAVVRFNAPATANAWTLELQLGYTRALSGCADDPEIAVVVVTGEGRHFCAGADLSLLDSLRRGEEPASELSPASVLRTLEFPKPLVAAVNGTAAGLGLIHALMCDVRILAADAALTTVFARMGLVAEHGAAWYLSQIMGRSAAAELLITGRSVGAVEALDLGLAHQVVPAGDVVSAAIEYARAAAEHGRRPGWGAVRRAASSDVAAAKAFFASAR